MISLERMKIADANEILDRNCRIEDIHELDEPFVKPTSDLSAPALLKQLLEAFVPEIPNRHSVPALCIYVTDRVSSPDRLHIRWLAAFQGVSHPSFTCFAWSRWRPPGGSIILAFEP